MTVQPVRLQRPRAKGARMVSPNDLSVRYVGRPTKCGNSVTVHRGTEGSTWDVFDYDGFLFDVFTSKTHAVFCAVARHRELLIEGRLPISVEDVRRELRGFNLAYWCALPKPGTEDLCHAATLLEVANA